MPEAQRRPCRSRMGKEWPFRSTIAVRSTPPQTTEGGKTKNDRSCRFPICFSLSHRCGDTRPRTKLCPHVAQLPGGAEVADDKRACGGWFVQHGLSNLQRGLRRHSSLGRCAHGCQRQPGPLCNPAMMGGEECSAMTPANRDGRRVSETRGLRRIPQGEVRSGPRWRSETLLSPPGRYRSSAAGQQGGSPASAGPHSMHSPLRLGAFALLFFPPSSLRPLRSQRLVPPRRRDYSTSGRDIQRHPASGDRQHSRHVGFRRRPGRWLDIELAGEALSPRQRITCTAFSIVSEDSRLLEGREASDLVEDGGKGD